jgi:CPA1 family monovalent cation:H+ antiporter
VLQGLTLPLLIRGLGIRDDGEVAREELLGREAATTRALERLGELRRETWTRDETVDRVIGAYEFRRRRLVQRAGHGEEDEDLEDRSHAYQRLLREVLEAQRAELVRQRDLGAISDGVLHRLEREFDLEDQRLEI